MSKQKNKQLVEGIRVAKEGIEECWADQQSAQGNEQMTVSISMPGKNISVTTDSAEEIGNILKLAGINVSGATPEQPAVTAIAIEPEGSEAPEQELVPMGAQTMAQAEAPAEEEPAKEGEEVMIRRVPEEDEMEEATQTPSSWTDSQGNTHPATKVQGKSYGNQDREEEDEDEDKEVEESILALQKLAGIGEAKKPDADGDGVPDWADKKPGADDNEEEVKEASGDAEDEKQDAEGMARTGMTHDEWEASEEDKEEDAMQEAARILRLAGVNEWANSPEDKANDEGTTFDKLPSAPGKGAGHPDFGQNRANNQGENPMGVTDVEEAFATAMGEYRKFVSESIARKK